MSETRKPVIGVVGGTGQEGGGLALRWANAGYRVIIGSRSAERAQDAAAELNALLGRDGLEAGANTDVAAQSDIVVLSVPYAAQKPTAADIATQLEGKILIDVTVPLMPPKVSRVQLPEGGSAVQALQEALGPGVRVVSAFQNVSAHHLKELDHAPACDVLVCSDDADAADQTIALAEAIGMTAWHAGPLANSAASEALTSVLIALNRRYKVSATGIRITGMPDKASS